LDCGNCDPKLLVRRPWRMFFVHCDEYLLVFLLISVFIYRSRSSTDFPRTVQH